MRMPRINRNTEEQAFQCDSGQALQCDSGQALQCDSGQAITAMLLFMSGLILSSTVIAGLLIVYQIRQAADSGSSAQAIFAADAGIEATLRCFYYELKTGIDKASGCNRSLLMGTGGSYSTKLFFRRNDGTLTTEKWDDSVLGFRVVSEGTKGRTLRILETNFSTR